MTLDALLALVCPEVPSSVEMEVSSIQLDSRLVTPGAVFIAIAGTASHGMHHIDEAIRRGAIAVLYDDWAVRSRRGFRVGTFLICVGDCPKSVLLGIACPSEMCRSLVSLGPMAKPPW